MKKILFPTDFSSNSMNAFKYALHMAHTLSAEILTLHVYQTPLVAYPGYANFLLEHYQVQELSEFENFKDEVPKLRAIAETEHMENVKMSHILKEGAVAHVILEVAAEEKVDFIIMGTKGATGLKEVFLGTVAQKIIYDSKTNVLTIPSDCEYQPIKKILFLTKYKKYQTELLKKVSQLADVLQADVDVLEVTAKDENQKEKFSIYWKSLHPESNVAFHLVTDHDTEGAILNFMAVHKTDLVTIAAHHMGFLTRLFSFSLAEKLTFHSQAPLLAIHENK